MSMTDGQWILDTGIFKDTMRPAVSTGLSVTRVGGVGQNKRQKGLAANLSKTLAGYRQAEEYAHFGTELSDDAQADYDKGKALFIVMSQAIGEGYSVMDQQFLLDIILGTVPGETIDIAELKKLVKDYTAKVVEDKDNSNFDTLRDELKAKVVTVAAGKSSTKEPVAEEKPTESDAKDKPEDDKKEEDKQAYKPE
jgi:F0F1-type ATP synthase alpha subunit